MSFDAKAYLEYFNLKRIHRSNDDYQSSCPDFEGKHPRGDRRPSFGINSLTGLCHCFACDLHMNLEQLTAKLLSEQTGRTVNEYEAWVWLEKQDWTPRELTPEELMHQLDKIDSNDVSITYPDSLLDEFTNGVHPSIIKRGISVEMAKFWELRYDPIHRRTVIPVRNLMNQLVGLVSRAVDDDAYIKHAVGIPQPEKQDEPIKYEFKKGLVVYGENHAYQNDTAVVIESPLDVCYAWSNELQKRADFLATFGGKPTLVHIERVRPYKRVILALDNDKTGQDGTEIWIRQLYGTTDLYLYQYPIDIKDLGALYPDQLQWVIDKAEPYLTKKLINIPLKLD